MTSRPRSSRTVFRFRGTALLPLLLAFLPACEVLLPRDRPFEVFENAPGWFEREFERGAEGLSTSFEKLGRAMDRDARNLGEDVGGVGDLVDREFRQGERGLAWQAGVFGKELARSTETTEENLLGAPGWIAQEFDEGFGGLESFAAQRWYRIRIDAVTFGRQLERFFTFLFR